MALLDNNVIVVDIDVDVVRLSGYPVGQLTEIPPRSRRAQTALSRPRTPHADSRLLLPPPHCHRSPIYRSTPRRAPS